ncbi:MAG TPA: cytochrome P450 [Solirubrobacteraceae bacterium]|nr:cytochrome P450 [Solirubrobacteraceae bacterium]
MGSVAPDRVTTNPLWWLYQDLRLERQSSEPLPPGELDFSVARTRRFARDPLPAMLEAYRRYGPIFTLRVLHAPVVFMLGPEANHFVTVSHAGHFHWREGSLGDLIPFLGDGLLTTDGAAHRQARRIMLPAFHRERIAASADTMLAETDRAMASWRPGATVDLYAWTRELALRIALRALFGLEPERRHDDVDLAAEFERGLSYYGADYFVQALRGPGTPWRRMRRARARLDRVLFAEIARRRRDGERREDVLSLLLDARDEHGATLTDGQVRDQVMTLLFAGHDTTTSTVTFLFYELARQPRAVAGLLAEQEAVLTPGAEPTAGQLVSELPRLEMAMDETLRLYPPAWVGPRRVVEGFEFAGHRVPAGARVNYCSWASHHLPEVFADPEAFVPERFAPTAKAALPKGAYVPFGGGSRTCIGMRFGQLEVKAIATSILRRFRLELPPGYELRIREMPTLSPRDGLPVVLRERAVPPALAGSV